MWEVCFTTMILSRISLLCLLSVVSIFDEVAESKAAGQLQSDFKVSLESWQQTVTDLETASDLITQVDEQTKVQTGEKNMDTTSDNWFGACGNLTDDLEKSWNLTVRVATRSGSVLWEMGGALYDLVNCEAPVLLPIKCIYHNLQRLRKIINPAVVEAYGFAKEGIKLVPAVIKDARKCYNF